MADRHTQEASPRRSRIGQLLYVCNVALVAGLLLCYLSFHVSPSSMGYFALMAFLYPLLLLANVAFVMMWLMRRRYRRMVIPVVAIAMGWSHAADLLQISAEDEVAEDEQEIKVMTWNVHLFGLYDWDNNERTRDAMFDLLDEEEADILCMQEFFHSDDEDYFQTRDTLRDFLPTRYFHERYTASPRRHHYFGVIIFSRFPIVKRGNIPFEGDANNYCIYADVKVGDDTVRVYNAHLQSIRLGKQDYEVVEENTESQELKEGSFRIMRKVRRALIRREDQVERIMEHIAQSPHRAVLCGDFNDPPHSWSYNRFEDLLEDSFTEGGNGLSNTFNHKAFPPLRIDYVLHSPGIRTLEYRRRTEDLSDHFPVITRLAVQKYRPVNG
ncbi:MAG: endonuclease/exonuclease/phosphatase family protein [Flavobacteriales bacterium]